MSSCRRDLRAGIIEMEENAGHSERAKSFLNELGVSEIKIDFQRGVGRGSQLIHSLNPMDELCGECWKGKLCVTSFGRVYPCVFSRFADLGTARSGVQSIVNDTPLLEFRTALRENRRRKQSRQGSSRQGSQHKQFESESSPSPDGFVLRSCDPDTDCGPDAKCEPTSSRCGPMVFEPCGPQCSPHAPGCSPLDMCSPSPGPVRLAGCDPTCAPCGPVSFCVPKRACAPDRNCDPTSEPCQPERSCVPKISATLQTGI
jgi:hypothetical protein